MPIVDEDGNIQDDESTSKNVHQLTLEDTPFKPITTLQLLKANTGISYPFSDKLIGYLVNNTITPSDSIPDNIKRVQAVMEYNGYTPKADGV